MTAAPWPHGWRSGMRRLRPTTGQSWRASRAWDQDEGGESLRWKQEPGGRLSDSEAPWPRDVPDLDDGPTKGALLDMVREGFSAPRACLVQMQRGRWGLAIPSPLRGGPRFVTDIEGETLKAALDHLAERVK